MNTQIDAIFNQVLDEACENPLYRFAELVRQEEREACAKLCEEQIKSYMSKQYTTDPLGGYRERFASEQCASEIRGRTE